MRCPTRGTELPMSFPSFSCGDPRNRVNIGMFPLLMKMERPRASALGFASWFPFYPPGIWSRVRETRCTSESQFSHPLPVPLFTSILPFGFWAKQIEDQETQQNFHPPSAVCSRELASMASEDSTKARICLCLCQWTSVDRQQLATHVLFPFWRVG